LFVCPSSSLLSKAIIVLPLERLGAILLSAEGEYDIKALTNLFADNYTLQFTQQAVRKTAYISLPTCPLAQCSSFISIVQKFT
jgi:hypothetical protein